MRWLDAITDSLDMNLGKAGDITLLDCKLYDKALVMKTV